MAERRDFERREWRPFETFSLFAFLLFSSPSGIRFLVLSLILMRRVFENGKSEDRKICIFPECKHFIYFSQRLQCLFSDVYENMCINILQAFHNCMRPCMELFHGGTACKVCWMPDDFQYFLKILLSYVFLLWKQWAFRIYWSLYIIEKKHVPKKFIQSTYRASEKLTGIPALQEDKKTGISKTE